ncbi:MAG TPA: AI-2E family transporter [Chloroflexota bacterium]|nr:AI-2E family transporter [Chloroflexota bacterium]
MSTSLPGRILTTGTTSEKSARAGGPSGVFFWILLALAAGFLYLIRGILPPFLIGGLIAYAISPVVDSLQERWKVARAVAVLATVVAFFGPLIAALIIAGPTLLVETRDLIVHAPEITSRMLVQTFGEGPYDLFGTTLYPRQVAFDLLDSLRETLGTPTNALHLASMVADLALNVFLTLIVTLYLLLDTARVENYLLGFASEARRPTIRAASSEIHRTLARYFRRELVLIAFVSFVVFLGLQFIFHLRFALPLAVFTGFVEIIPFLGPVVAGTVAALIALSQGGSTLAIGVIVFYIVVRQIEDQIVMPVVLSSAVELHPLIVIFAVLAGETLGGILGALLAVPIAASIKVVIDYWPRFVTGEPEVSTEEGRT